MDLFVSLEQARFSVWVRESGSLFAFPGILLFHTYGMAVLVAVVAAIDLRILGFAPGFPLAPLEKFLPILWLAFWVNAVTGTVLLVADATTKMANPAFFAKLGFIAAAVVVQRMIQKRVFRDPQTAEGARFPAGVKALAVASLTCWLGAITAGRLLAYVGPVSGLE
jgi:hypothetical protein